MPSREVSGRAGSGEGKRLNIEKRNVGGEGEGEDVKQRASYGRKQETFHTVEPGGDIVNFRNVLARLE